MTEKKEADKLLVQFSYFAFSLRCLKTAKNRVGTKPQKYAKAYSCLDKTLSIVLECLAKNGNCQFNLVTARLPGCQTGSVHISLLVKESINVISNPDNLEFVFLSAHLAMRRGK